MKKKVLRFISTALMAVILVTIIPADLADAALQDVSSPAKVTSFKSSTNFDKEYVQASVSDGSVLNISYRTPLETSLFRVSLYRLVPDKGDMDLDIFVEPEISTAADGTMLYGFSYHLDTELYDIPDGYYNLYLRRCATPIDAMNLNYKSSGVLYKNMEIRISGGKVSILRYNDVINYNRSIQKIGQLYTTDRYLDNTLEDIKFVLRNPATNVYATMTYDKISFINNVSDRVTQGAYTDYDKLLKIYEYTAKNFYYDSVAFSTHSMQFADPYDNIRNFEYGNTSSNSSMGRVYTTCQGYSAIFTALARAQGIPTRFVYGHRLAVPSNDWRTEDNIDVRDHWWVESYVNGRWIFIDPTVGTTNKYNKTTGEWTYTGMTNYTYFDPSEDQIATSHVYMNIYPDYRYGKYITNQYEMDKLTAFMNISQESDNPYSYYKKTNGSLMNSSYSQYDTSTWGDGLRSHFMTDGRGNTEQIQWSNYGLVGTLDLSGFTRMKLLSSHHNNLESANLSNCPLLEKVYLNDNNLTSLDLSGSKKAWYVRVQNNPMKYLNMYVNGADRTFEAGENGTFYFTLDTRCKGKEFSLYSKPDIGYKLEGIYSTGTGNLISQNTTYHFTPQASGYRLSFTVDPDSYKYTIMPGDSQSYKAKYLQAAVKRLSELGYCNYVGDETVYNDQLVQAAIRFQVINDISNTGNIGKTTWAALFSETAKPMVNEWEYPQVLADYEARKALEKEAEEQLANVKIKASSTAVKGAMKLSWTVTDSVSGEAVTEGIDGYEIYKSTSKTSGYSLLSSTGGTAFKNTTKLTKGTRYYYKVRAYRMVGEKKIYSPYSNVTYKLAK